ncbi:MAG: ABC transporter permease [Candidatus Acidiferrales bacterium]
MMEGFCSDVRFGIRMLLRSPGFSIVAIATLALGIGANTALFSLVNGILLAPLRFPQADRLVSLYEHRPQFGRGSISYPNFLDWQRNNQTLQSLAAYRSDDFSLTGLGEPERLDGNMVSANFFPTLGVKPTLGQDFDPRQDVKGGKPEVMISAGLWKKKFGSAPDAIGKTMTLDGTDYTIVGVVPPSFRLHMWNFRAGDVYVPIGQWKDVIFHDRNVALGMDAVGRLKPGVTMEQARADMEGVTQQLAAAYPEANTDVGVTLISLKENITGDLRPYLLLLLAAVFFVLLIACVNVANLLLARSMRRAREFAIRAVMGASKVRVIRQLLTESVLLSLCGGGFGLLVATWGTQFAIGFLPDGLPRAEEIRMDGRVLIFTLLISVLSGILFGLAPALRLLKPRLQETLKEGGRSISGARSRAQRALVIAEMALALVLLIGAGLMVRSLGRLWSVDPGFNPKNILLIHLALPPAMNTAAPDAIIAELRRVHDEVAAVPGVQAVSLQRGGLPMWGDSEDPFWIEGRPKPSRDSDMSWGLWYEVEPDYLKVMGIPLKRGRFFTEQDNDGAPLVTVIDEDLAEKYFPHEDPIGKSLVDEFVGKPAKIVGIVGHVKHWGLDDKVDVHAQFYVPFMQIPKRFVSRAADSTGMLIRTEGIPPRALLDPIRKNVEEANSQEVVYEPHTYDELISRSLADRLFSMVLLGVFAALALLLSSIGIYGVISYLVGQRTHEIGIRIALGAQRRHVLMMVLSEGTKTALIGVAIGLVAALALTRLMAGVLYGISTTDPITFTAVAAVLTMVALAACYIPARRAMRVDPVIALRYE